MPTVGRQRERVLVHVQTVIPLKFFFVLLPQTLVAVVYFKCGMWVGGGGGLYVHLLWLLLLCGALSQRKDEADQRGLGIASIEEQRSKVYRRACQCVLKIDTSRQ